jgi:gliding motility-associated-like protein
MSFTVIGQTPADWWYFGMGAGVHFETGGPVSDPNGELQTFEGCASISSSSGDLLFYTDGLEVYDATHTLMANGSGLLGDPSSSQSAIVVPKPQSSNFYYIFTVDDGAQVNGTHYTLVDMSLNGGLGDVVTTEKNIPLVTPTAEKIASVQKPNGYWVVTLKISGDTCYAYEVTAAGVNLTPVLSNTGVSLTTANFWGYLKPNIQGDKLAFISQGISEAYVFDFDNSTGMVTGSTAITQSVGGNTGYGVEFSPDGNLLYTMSYSINDVKHYDLTLATAALISASEVILGSTTSGTGGGALQLGPDGKLYVCRSGKTFLSVINDPNTYGTGAGYQDTALMLNAGATCRLGLPTFIQSFFNIEFSYSEVCFGDTTCFLSDTVGVDETRWYFGDPASGAFDSTYVFNPKHFYSDTGVYDVMLVAFSDTLVDTSYQTVRIFPRQTVSLGVDTTVCTGTQFLYDVSQLYSSYMWHDSTTLDTFLTNQDTLISVTVFGVCDTVMDQIRITYDDTIRFDLGPDTTLCGGNFYFLNADINVNANLLWSTGDSLDTLSITESGNYFLHADNTCGLVMDTVTVIFLPIPSISLLPEDTINCFDNEIVLRHPDVEGTTYIWSDSSSKKTYRVDTTETVWLAAFNECGSTLDTINLYFNKEIISELGVDTTICDLDTISLNAFSPGATYLWNTGDTIDSILTGREGQLYVVTVTEGLCQTIESKRVDLSDVFCPGIDCDLIVSNVITPNGDGVNDIWRVTSDCDIVKFGLNIYNRWGQLIHSSDNAKFGWDGTIAGAPAQEGVYYYELYFKDTVVVDIDSEDFRGSITLLK